MRFVLLGVPVVVRPAFWITAVFLSLLGRTTGPVAMGASVAIVFAAVLAHELGHALTARAFGASPLIVLHGLGGVTSRDVRMSRPQTILVTLAGPGAGFLLGGVCLLARGAPFESDLAQELIGRAELCTFSWGMLNLLPVLPLDGGVILREILGPRFARTTYILSTAFALVLFVASINPGGVLEHVGLGRGWSPWLTVLAGFWAVDSARRAWSYADERAAEQLARTAARSECDAAAQALQEGDPTRARALSERVLRLAPDPPERDRARRLLATSAIEQQRPTDAMRALATIEDPNDEDDVLRAQALDGAGDREGAFRLLASRAALRPAGPALVALLRGLLATDALDRAATLAITNAAEANVDVLNEVATALTTVGRHSESLRLYRSIFARNPSAPHTLATLHAATRAGDLDAAFAILAQAAPTAALAPLLQDPAFVVLRDDPRFASWKAQLAGLA